MFSIRSRSVLGAVVGAALLVGVAVAPGVARADTRSTAEGLLVFAVEDPGHDTEWFSLGNSRSPFGGEQYDSLTNAVLFADEFDLSHFDDDGRIKTKVFNTCLGVQPETPVRPARAVAQSCDATNANQEWRIDSGNGDRLRNTGTGLYVESMLPFSGWSMTADVTKSPYRMLADYIDGRPVVQPDIDVDYDHGTDTFVVSGRGGPAQSAVGVFGAGGSWAPLDTTDDDGAFSAELPREFGDLEFVEIAVGQNPRLTVELRVGAPDHARFVHRPDGAVVLYADAIPGYTVNVGTGPFEDDIVASDVTASSGLVEIVVPDAEPGDEFVAYIGSSGVRTKVTVPARKEYLRAVDGPETTLDRTRPTRVPFGLRAEDDVARITSTITLAAPAGTVFTPGQTIDGEAKPAGGAWSGIDPSRHLEGVAIAPDGRTMTATFDLGGPGADGLHSGDELRWWPTLDVVDPATAPASV